MIQKFRKNNKGFTLVELLVVIAIIAILAAVIAPNAFRTIERSKITAITSDFRAMKTATLVYYSDTGLWPEDGAGQEGFIDDPGIVGWNGPYLDVWVENAPLGDEYEFVNAGEGDGEFDMSGTDVNDAPEEAVYLRITDLPENAFDRLTVDLGENQVFVDGTNWPADVYLLIAAK